MQVTQKGVITDMQGFTQTKSERDKDRCTAAHAGVNAGHVMPCLQKEMKTTKGNSMSDHAKKT